MSLNNLNIKSTYRSINDDIVNDFFITCLKESNSYRRGVGFFSLNGLKEIIQGLIPLILRGEKVQIIASPKFSESDLQLLTNSIDSNEIISNVLLEQFSSNQHEDISLELIANLVINNLIEIKIAYIETGIYHEKIAIFGDTEGNYISANGSNNETVNGYTKHIESFFVRKSWEDLKSTKDDIKYFDSLWSGEIKEIKIIALPNAIKEIIINLYNKNRDLETIIKELFSNKVNSKEETRELYDFQEEAIKQFNRNNFCHFYQMATGTGKTFTAIRSIRSVFEYTLPLVIIVVPQIDLQNQWKNELIKEGFRNITFLGGTNSINARQELLNVITEFNISDGESKSIIISTYDTFFSKVISLTKNIENIFIIFDEAHNITENQIDLLPNNFKYRLGLSATPERHSKNTTEKILEYFTRGEIESYIFSIDEAIKRNFLSQYNYIPIFVRLTDDEFDKFLDINFKIAKLMNLENVDSEAISLLSNKRNLIIKKAKSKIEKLEEISKNHNYTFNNSVIYCGQGKYEDDEDSLIDKTIKILNNSGYRISSFTSKTENRDYILKLFENNYYDTLAAIKCFDEGIDVPKLDKIYILSSDKNKRQTIQRRGRVLRKCKESGKNIATIYDFVVLPPNSLLEKNRGSTVISIEFERVNEYLRLANNKEDFIHIIERLSEEYYINNAMEIDDES